MITTGIDHLEFYVGDARQTAFYLCTAFGFEVCGQGGPETGLTGQRSLLLRQGDIHLVLTTGLVTDHPATEYVRRHGDGVAVVALAVDDVAAAYSTLVRRGADALTEPTKYPSDATMVYAEVSGFGDVTHRLVQRGGEWRELLPGIAVTTPPAEGARPLLNTIDHLAICVPAGRLVPTVGYYSDVFGFTPIYSEYIEVGGQGMDSTVVQDESGLVTFTLIEPDPTRRRGQIDDFLQWHAGAGVQHVAFATDDIVTAVRTMSGHGVGFLGTPGTYYDALTERFGELGLDVAALRELGILVDRDQHGQLLQIFTESMHVRRTLFLEVIERRGARTFGSGNIKALYSAKERELAESAS